VSFERDIPGRAKCLSRLSRTMRFPFQKRPRAVTFCRQTVAHSAANATKECGYFVALQKPEIATFPLQISFGEIDVGGCRMANVIIIGGLAGALCGVLCFRVFVIFPIAVILILLGSAIGVTVHAYLWTILAEIVGSIAALQMAYAAVSLSLDWSASSGDVPSFIRAAIGRQLRAELEAPRDLPPELSMLVARLRAN
jgi:hypothetical protein